MSPGHAAYLSNGSGGQKHDLITICPDVCEELVNAVMTPVQPNPWQHMPKNVAAGDRAVHIAYDEPANIDTSVR
jgi:hypothetical protein